MPKFESGAPQAFSADHRDRRASFDLSAITFAEAKRRALE
jgi:hypothetical protein